MITCELLAVYGEKKYNVFADANDIHQLSHGRDVRKEAAANQLVRSCFSAYDARKHQMLLQGADEMYEFLSSGMEDLQKLGEIFVSDRLKAIRVIPAPKVSVGVSLAENVLELHLNPGNFGMEELAEILSKYDRKKKFYRLRTRSLGTAGKSADLRGKAEERRDHNSEIPSTLPRYPFKRAG